MTGIKFFTQTLLQWNENENDRTMPWKDEKDPYKIWLSEIILQQTRVNQGIEYYKKFVQRFPTICDLAGAEERIIYKMWEGLGYYSRCKNLINTAKYVCFEKKGLFPNIFEELLALKGIGNYTASAIASFAYNLPYAVLDGNVYRVLSRFFGIFTPIDSAEGKLQYSQLSTTLLDRSKPGEYNQAIMDFGATICKPKLPKCEVCPLSLKCKAKKEDIINNLPVKERKIIISKRWFYYFVINNDGHYFVKKRTGGDIWENLFEFPLLENDRELPVEQLKKSSFFSENFKCRKRHFTMSKVYSQKLTHQLISGQFIEMESIELLNKPEYLQVSENELRQLPFPKFITTYLTDKNVFLNLSK